jgi:pimeloyl-ACP methyl ester carboxylesterase
MTETIEPFRIEVPGGMLADLSRRLERTRLAPDDPLGDFSYGFPTGYLRELLDYWRDGFDWRAAEAALNAMPQYRAALTTGSTRATLHFVHARGRGPDSFPLLFCHGWPGSFWEVQKILGPLTDPAAHGGDPGDAFDVIAPSLPGYGFSPHPGVPGINEAVVADLFNALMTGALGYQNYGAQGGDWGAIVTTCLARDHPDTVAGIHLNMVAANPHVSSETELTDAEREYLAKRKQWSADEGAYRHVQETKPQTLAAGLQDSPAGLAAWIAEKFRAWSDCGSDVETVFSKDDLLTNIMIYWATGTIATAMRLYFERRNNPERAASNSGYIGTPTGFAKFPKEISDPPREWLERAHNLKRWTEFASGGHFAALEKPAELVNDIREFYRPLRKRSATVGRG